MLFSIFIQDFYVHAPLCCVVCLQIVICMPVMWTIIGPATLSGITFLGIIVIFNGFFVASWIKGFQVNINISFIMNFDVYFSDPWI